MNSVIIFLVNLLFLTGLTSNVTTPPSSKVPQKIVSIAQEFYEVDYYQSQAELWKIEIDKDQSNADAWINYYRACRFVNMLGGAEQKYNLDEVYSQLVDHIKGTYEYHYLSYVNGGSDPSLFHHITAAYELDPDRTDVYSIMINDAVIKQDAEKMKMFNEKWMASGEISPGVLSWNYNSLMSLEPNAILFTHGDNDTYPAWMLQQVKELRTDVEVVNVNFLRKRSYCEAIFRKCGIPTYDKNINDELTWENDFSPLADHVIKHAIRPIQFSVTLPKSMREKYGNNLYTVGLSFKYSNESFDNIQVLKDNYENKFLTDYMLLGFENDKSVTVLNSMNMSYLPGFLSLMRHYIKEGDEAKRERIGNIIGNIAEAGGQLQTVNAIIESSRKLKPLTETNFDIKSLDKTLMSLGNGLYAADTEVLNIQYEQFLMDLLRNKEFELLDKCKTGKTDWISFVPEMHKGLNEEVFYDNGHPDDPLSPIQNISHEAAQVYCEWLSRAYNGYAKKKRFNEVRFRLPTEQEWIEAAEAGRDLARYPWGGYYYQNSKGCYLANFHSSEKPMCEDCDNRSPDNDGAFFTVKGDAYFPNDFGLYGMSGNVAEMVQEKGIAKGGSWEDIPEECTIQSVKKVNGPSPAVGFRVFMEVINN